MSEVKKILITGATGFIGKHLLDELDNENFSLYILSRNKSTELKQKNVKILTGDLFDLEKFSEQLAGINYIVHIAGEKRDESLMQSVNLEGTKSLLQAIEKYPQIKMVHVSSSGVYGIEKHPETILTENSACYPNNTYEKTKYQSEQIVASIAKEQGRAYSIVRPSNIFGEDDSGRKLLTLLSMVKRNRFFFINTKAMVNYVYVKQVTRMIKEIISKDIFRNEIYNLNSPVTISELIAMIKDAVGIKEKAKRIPSFLSMGIMLLAKIGDVLPKRFQLVNSGKYRELTSEKYYSTEKIRSIIAINEREMLNTGIHNLVNHYKSKQLL